MSHIVEIISERQQVKEEHWILDFINVEDNSCGFSFPCDKNGNIIKDEYYDCWIKNYEYCISHPDEFINNGVQDGGWWYIEPAVAKCSCGRQIVLDDQYMGACQCECGQWYNLFGQALIEPEYWEEDEDY